MHRVRRYASPLDLPTAHATAYRAFPHSFTLFVATFRSFCGLQASSATKEPFGRSFHTPSSAPPLNQRHDRHVTSRSTAAFSSSASIRIPRANAGANTKSSGKSSPIVGAGRKSRLKKKVEDEEEAAPTTPVKPSAIDIASWEDAGLPEQWISRLKSAGFYSPTEIQRKAFNRIANGDNCVLRAESGAGKTLAYLLPLFKRLLPSTVRKQDEINKRSPSIVVITHTWELAAQIVKAVNSLGLGLNCSLIPPSPSTPFFPDVAVSTVRGFHDYAVKSVSVFRVLGRTEAIVFDEADLTTTHLVTRKSISMFVKVNRERALAKPAPHRPRLLQYVCAASALSDYSLNRAQGKNPIQYLNSKLQNLAKVDTLSVHRLPENLQTTLIHLETVQPNPPKPRPRNDGKIVAPPVIDPERPFEDGNKVSYAEECFREKFDLLVNQLQGRRRLAGGGERWIVFCKDARAAVRLYAEIKRSTSTGEIESTASVWVFHPDMPRDRRDLVINHFTTAAAPGPSSNASALDILVTTDHLSRGIDFHRVSTVINFDYPASAADFLVRAGRTARGGRKGTVISFADAESVPFAEKVRAIGPASFANHAREIEELLDGLSGRKKKKGRPGKVERELKRKEKMPKTDKNV
ncbi:P-loop containing nucleoside triphosphate hydrolase protein [Zopfochytrium polystomum]|nr:P-loop containing nucleoside triphosphate hydrolase protein [Zopfochytrium polystomum]